MRFGFMEDFRNPPQWRRPFPELYRALLEQIRRGEELGYDHVWLTEHHFTEDGYNPSILATAAAIATCTRRIRIGTFILLLPYQHPVRAAEDVACADIFSGGRFDLGVGQGYSYHEFNALCMDRRERGARMREGLALMERLFREDRVTFEGRFHRVRDLRLSPKPVQQPHPPIWIGARGPTGVRNAAKLGHHLLATLGPDPAPLYVEALEAEGRDPAQFRIAQLRMVYVAESEDRAWEGVREHIFHLYAFYHDILSEAKDAAGDADPLPFSRPEEIRNSPYAEGAMIGTPQQVSEKLERFCAEYRCTDLILATQFPGLDPARGTRSLELFAKEVMPHFRNR